MGKVGLLSFDCSLTDAAAGVELRLLGVEVSGKVVDLSSSEDFSGVKNVLQVGLLAGFLIGDDSSSSDSTLLSKFDLSSSSFSVSFSFSDDWA